MKREESLLIESLAKEHITLSSASYTKLFEFLKFLLETNQTFNLTSITDYKEAIIKHIFDSLAICGLSEFKTAVSIMDVGSGAGLPGIPLAIAYPEKKLASVDPVQKKIRFQEQACQNLQISNFTPIWARAEDLAKQPLHRESYDLVLARALAPMNILVELTLPFLKAGGFALLYKGKDYEHELGQSGNAVAILGGEVIHVIKAELPEDFGTRNIIMIKKIKTTPEKFPRKAGIPQKKPII